MTAKLRINLADGTVDVEGEDKFVERVYADFRDKLFDQTIGHPTTQLRLESGLKAPFAGSAQKRAGKETKRSSAPKSKSGRYEPEVNPDLNLAKLPAFYSAYTPQNVSEKILIFAVFVRDQLNKSPCTANDIYSCFFALKKQTKIPEAFQQAFVNAWNRTKWIQYETMDDIRVTTAGENHFTEMSEARTAE